MEIAVVVEQVQQVAAVRGDDAAGRAELEAALRTVGRLQSWLTASKAALTSKLAAQVSFPEATIADCTRGSTRDAVEDTERAHTLDRSPSLADALDDAKVTAGHVDEVTRAIKNLEGPQRDELFDRLDGGLLDVAAVATVEDWRKRLHREVASIRRDDGMDRLERQRRATRLRTWVDGDGMWCLSGSFDPVTGVRLAARLDAAIEALFAKTTPDTSPSDPIERQHHLRALALTDLLDNASGGGARPGRPEYVVVIDASTPDGAGGPTVDWGLPVEVPTRVLADLIDGGQTQAIVVRNGVVLHAPGELDLGRTTRLANRAQRRALRAMYATCAIPGCGVRFDRCKLHHITWWRHGGRTDLDNLLPVCTHHHGRIHDGDWQITLGPNRELTVRFPDGTVHNTGPPTRRAA